MTRLFDERERAAENIYAHEEQRAFLARRRGIRLTAKWVAEGMALDRDAAAQYEERMVDAFVSGRPENELVQQMQTDLERAGKPTLSMQVATQLSQSVAESALGLRGQNEKALSHEETPREAWARHHPKDDGSWGWGL